MQNNNEIKEKYQETLKNAFLSMENNDDSVVFLKVLYRSCNFHSFNKDVNSLLFMEGRRSLYQNIFMPFMSKELRRKVEIGG